MKKFIIIPLTVGICCIGYERFVRPTKGFGTSPPAPGSAAKVTTPPPPPHQGPTAESLEEGFKTPWTKIEVAFMMSDGCTGWHPICQLFITRRDNGMTVFGRVHVALGKHEDTAERPLTDGEFNEISTKLHDFSRVARQELNPEEYFTSLQPADRDAYVREHGTPYGGFGGFCMVVNFNTNKPEMFVRDTFASSKSASNYGKWMQGVLK